LIGIALLLGAANPVGTPTTLSFSSVQLDGGTLTSQSFAANTHPVSVVCGATSGTNATTLATVNILGSNDNVNFSSVGTSGSISIVSGAGTKGVAVATSAPFPYAYAEVQVVPNTAQATWDGGVCADGGTGADCTACSNTCAIPDAGAMSDSGVLTGCTAMSLWH
jgi:hypothetical protein